VGINSQVITVSNVINRDKFEIKLDLSQLTPYESQGLVKYVKTPKIIKGKPIISYYNQYIDLIKKIDQMVDFENSDNEGSNEEEPSLKFEDIEEA
jgi:hypothetical protein